MAELAAFFCMAWHRLLSPLFGCNCRYYPSCSEYAAQAFRECGFCRGSRLSILRILRCNALSPGGYDPVSKATKR